MNAAAIVHVPCQHRTQAQRRLGRVDHAAKSDGAGAVVAWGHQQIFLVFVEAIGLGKIPHRAMRLVERSAADDRGAGVRVASRLSDRNEPLTQCLSIPADVVWGDEFDRLWLTDKEAREVKAAGRLLYMISPEIHGFDLAAMRRRWQDFKAWEVDGVCTDYPVEAQEFFGK